MEFECFVAAQEYIQQNVPRFVSGYKIAFSEDEVCTSIGLKWIIDHFMYIGMFYFMYFE